MEENEYKEHLKKFKKSEIIDFLIKKDREKRESEANLILKYKKRMARQIKAIETLQKSISNINEIKSKLDIEVGQKVFVEYLSVKGMIRTAMGLLVLETRKHIKIRITDKQGSYYYVINKDEIKGIKIYRD